MSEYPPYYIVPVVEALATCVDCGEAELLRRRIAINVGDAEVRRHLFGMTGIDTEGFYPQNPARLSTEATIDSFLERFGGGRPSSPQEEPEEIPLAPAVDYITLLSLEENRNVEDGIEGPEKPEEEEISEETAKLLIKKGNYERAYQIIEALSLKNPEKSIYFADQLRFLRKLKLLSGAAGL